MTGKCRKKMLYLISMLVISETVAKTYSDTDLTSDFTSAVDDQYPWSALPPRKGPTVQDTLEWKWTATDRSEKGPIDKFLQSPWKKSSLLLAKHNSRPMSSGKEIEDKGPGSIEIYRLNNIEDGESNVMLLPRWNNPEFRKKIMKSKSPKKVYRVDHKNSHKVGIKKDDLPVRKTHRSYSKGKDNDSVGVPELQIGCEGLEAPIEPSNREPRSISVKNDSTREDTYVESRVPPVSRVNPVTIDWNYQDNDQHQYYEEMDELLKLKKLEGIPKKKLVNRGDMVPEDSDVEFDFKKVPVRGDLVGGRKVRSILDRLLSSKAAWRDNDGPWGFDENDGYISEDEDESDSSNAQRVEAERRRQEYERKQREEMERRRVEQLERQRQWEREREEVSRRNDNQVDSQIEKIREEYERRLSAEQRERERKLKDYIERNRPIVVESREERERRLLEEMRRRAQTNGNYDPRVRPYDRSRGPSPPVAYPSTPRYNDADRKRFQEEAEAEDRRLREEYQRRRQQQEQEYQRRREEEEEERRRLEDERRRELENQRYNSSRNNSTRRRLEEEERQRQIQSRLEEEDRRHRIMEHRHKELGVISLDEVERKKWEEARLNSLPVSARIILVPNSSSTRSSTLSPLFSPRGNFDNDIDLPAINPHRPGLNAGRFPVAPTPRPPSNSPGACVWAVVQCCPNGDQRRLSNCFEYMGCPGVNWDPSPCRGSIADAARAEVVRYYATADQP